MRNFKKLSIWAFSMELVLSVYKISSDLPNSEKFSLSSQIRRAAISIPSNIAEGSNRGEKEFIRYLNMALGSSFELETQLLIGQKLGYFVAEHVRVLLDDVIKTQKQIHALILTIRRT